MNIVFASSDEWGPSARHEGPGMKKEDLVRARALSVQLC